MKTAKAALHGFLWIIIILFQIVVGFVTGYNFFAEGYGDLVFMWLGITLGVFVIGLVSTVFCKTFQPKKYLVRLGLSGLCASLPLIIFYQTDLFFYNADYETPLEFPLLAVLMGILGFYVFHWLNNGRALAKTAQVTGYGMSVLMIAAGCFSIWNWLTPFPLPLRGNEPEPLLNMELVNIVGEGFQPEVIRGNYLYGISNHRLVVFDISDPVSISLIGQSEIIPGDLRRINLFGNYAYITAGGFGYNDGNKLHVVQITDPSRPHYLASYNLTGEYIWGVYNFKHYLYIIGCIECGQSAYDQHALYVMDLSDPQTPVEIGHYYSDINISDIAFYGEYAYLALAEAEKDHDSLRILDLTDPGAPRVVASLFPSAKGNHIAISAQRLYFDTATQDPTEDRLHILDLSNPVGPREIASHLHAPFGQFSVVSDGILYTTNVITTCGCGENDEPPEIVVTVMDCSDPASPRKLQTFDFGSYTLDVEGQRAFAWDSVDQAYKFYDLSNRDAPREAGNYVPFSLHDLSGEIFVNSSLAVIGTDETNLYILDISNPSLPVLSSIYDAGDYYWLIGLYGAYAYVHVEEEIQVVDISDPESPVIVWRYAGMDADGGYTSMVIKGHYAYLSNSVDGLYVYDISDSKNPVLVNLQKELAGYGPITGFNRDGTHFYIFGEEDVRIFDASNPMNIVEVARIDQRYYQKITLVGDLAFLDDSLYSGQEPTTLSIFDLSNPATLNPVSSYNWPKWAKISGDSEKMVYIADMFYGLTIEDFSDPQNPKVLGTYDMEDGAIGAAAGDDNFIYVLSNNTYALHVLRYIPPSPSPMP